MPEVNLGKVVGPKGSDGAQGPAGADGLSAYEQAQAGGYSGSELEFNQQLAGLSDGPFVPESDKGVASGVATLDSTGKVPSGQLPSMDYIPTSQKGAASGVASLDATGKLKKTQKPDYTASEVGAVPTARTVNGKSLSADVVLTGEDIKTSASDETTISSQLSNLAGGKLPKTLDAATEQDFDTIIPDAGELKAYRAFNPTAHLPPGYSAASCDFFVLAFCEPDQLYVRQLAFDVRSTAIWTRRSWDDYGERVWDDWQQVRTSDAPEVYTFPAAAGISGDSQYCKTQDGMVLLFIDALNTSEFSDQDLIGTMPVGFRPANNVYTAVAATESDGGYVQFAELGVDPDGDVTVYMSASKPRLRGFIMFPA